MVGRQWEVVGGADKGGIMVRAGRELTSQQLPEKLSTGAFVEELERAGERLHFRRLTGSGPEEGWVSVRLKDKVLLEQRSAGDEPPPAPVPGQPPQPPQPPQPQAAPADDYASRLAALKEKFPGTEALQIPEEARRWAPKDLENYFESGGFIKPIGFEKKPAPPPPPKPPEKKKPAGAAPDVPQFNLPEALSLQDKLRDGFKDKDFQQRLLKLQNEFPNRKQRGHADGAQFFEAFEALAMTVYSKVLPRHNLSPDWDGVRDMYAKMVTALMHPKVKKQHEELNTLLGLPRDAVLKPSKRAEEVFVYRPAGDAELPAPPLPLLEDEEGDEAHEFLAEDPETGELRSLLESTSCWYKVAHKPHITVRSKPDGKANPVCTKMYGARIRVQRVAGGGKWLMLHEAELKKLNVSEAWALCDGKELGLGVLLQRLAA